ncbi:MAG: hypothetical protein V1702_02875 [Candidatus Woesearchaeota archaeon]
MGIEARVKAAVKPLTDTIVIDGMTYTLLTYKIECQKGHYYVTSIGNDGHLVITYPKPLGGRTYPSPCFIESDKRGEAKALHTILFEMLRNKKTEADLVDTFREFKERYISLKDAATHLTPQSA